MAVTFFTPQDGVQSIPLVEYEEATKTKNLFNIIAHAFLYHLRKGKLEFSFEEYLPIFQRHAKYFPKQIPVHVQKLSAKEQYEYLITYNHPHSDILEPALAHTLQQLAIDMMAHFPALYGNLIIEDGFSVKELRASKNIHHPAALHALANEVLYINIYLERYQDNYFLPVKEYYLCQEKTHSEIFLHYQDHYYTTPSDLGIKEEG